MNVIPNNNASTSCTENTTNSIMKPNFKKLPKTKSDSQILRNVTNKCRKKSV